MCSHADFRALIPDMELVRINRKIFSFFLTILLSSLLTAQTPQTTTAPSVSPTSAPDYSGMYSFLRDGEFLQLNVENDGKLTGFVSRYGDTDSDRGVFLEQFFKNASLNGNSVSFTTLVVHGVYFDFQGTIIRGEGKNPNDEAYYILKGKLTQHTTGANDKVTDKTQETAFKSFPRDVASPQ